jgi:hypothetical protein
VKINALVMELVNSIEIVNALLEKMVNLPGLVLIAPSAPAQEISLGLVRLSVLMIFIPGLNAPIRAFVIAKQENVNAFQGMKELPVLVPPAT